MDVLVVFGEFDFVWCVWCVVGEVFGGLVDF